MRYKLILMRIRAIYIYILLDKHTLNLKRAKNINIFFSKITELVCTTQVQYDLIYIYI